jgi:heterodisulfide reductase subunit A
MENVLVIGGGITGIQTALDLSKLGFSVTLLEKEAELGGKLNQLSALFPRGESARDLLAAKKRQLEASDNIQITTGGEIESVGFQPSGYTVALKGRADSLEAQAAVIATGFDPFDPTPIEEYGYGRLKDLITAFELEAQLQEEKVIRPSTGSPPQSVSFLQCVGSRDRRTNRYCSYFCCTYAVKEALAVKKLNPSAEITILYMDIRTPYLYEHLYTEAREKDIRFVRSRVSGITEEDGHLDLDIENTLTGESETLTSELVVLSTGGVPAGGNQSLAEQFKLTLSDQGFFKVEEPPVLSGAEGVFIAGTASGLKDIPQCLAEASAGAIQVSAFMNGRKT